MGAFFLLKASGPQVAGRAVISADVKEISQLILMFWRLLQDRSTEESIAAQKQFNSVNLGDIVFRKSTRSHAAFDGNLLLVEADEKTLERYALLLESLMVARTGHQVLHTASRDREIELMVSVGEYSRSMLKMIKRAQAGA